MASFTIASLGYLFNACDLILPKSYSEDYTRDHARVDTVFAFGFAVGCLGLIWCALKGALRQIGVVDDAKALLRSLATSAISLPSSPEIDRQNCSDDKQLNEQEQTNALQIELLSLIDKDGRGSVTFRGLSNSLGSRGAQIGDAPLLTILNECFHAKLPNSRVTRKVSPLPASGQVGGTTIRAMQFVEYVLSLKPPTSTETRHRKLLTCARSVPIPVVSGFLACMCWIGNDILWYDAGAEVRGRVNLAGSLFFTFNGVYDVLLYHRSKCASYGAHEDQKLKFANSLFMSFS
jgi:hypothetical protein